MEAIELITSLEKDIIIKDKKTGMSRTVRVKVWNKTVANLSLMVLGSSAPEIMLSVIEIIGDGFEAGSLGPGTIVGSAAFNFFVIIAICMYVIPGKMDLWLSPTSFKPNVPYRSSLFSSARLLVQYLDIYNNETLPNQIKNLTK